MSRGVIIVVWRLVRNIMEECEKMSEIIKEIEFNKEEGEKNCIVNF